MNKKITVYLVFHYLIWFALFFLWDRLKGPVKGELAVAQLQDDAVTYTASTSVSAVAGIILLTLSLAPLIIVAIKLAKPYFFKIKS